MKTKKAAAAAPEIHYKDMQNTPYQQINPHTNNPVDLITADIESPQEDTPSGMFEVMPVNEMIGNALFLPLSFVVKEIRALTHQDVCGHVFLYGFQIRPPLDTGDMPGTAPDGSLGT